MNRVIIVGSPRSNGRSAHLAEMLFEACIDECPEDELYLVPVSELQIGPCIGCGGCRKARELVFENDDGSESTELRHRCVFDDDMQEIYGLIEDADEITVVSPIYFSGAPSPMKALLDRLQPFFWRWLEERAADGPAREKRPAVLHVVGEGGDSNGYVPLVAEVRSALAVAGFKLERVIDWVGKIDPEGEILEEAATYTLPPLGTPLATLPQVDEGGAAVVGGEAPEATAENAKSGTRPRLDLSAPAKKGGKSAPTKAASSKSSSAKSASAKTTSPKKTSGKKGKRRG